MRQAVGTAETFLVINGRWKNKLDFVSFGLIVLYHDMAITFLSLVQAMQAIADVQAKPRDPRDVTRPVINDLRHLGLAVGVSFSRARQRSGV